MKRRAAIKIGSALAGITALPIGISLIQGCKQLHSANWEPKILSREMAEYLEVLTRNIVPPSDLNIPTYIDLIVNDCLSDEKQQSFASDINILMQDCVDKVGQPLSDLSEDEALGYVQQLDQNTYAENSVTEVSNAYRVIKELTLKGYFTSEKIMTTMLDYHAIPGEYKGCIDVAAETRVYVDNNV